mgnify:CR=1 FL=1
MRIIIGGAGEVGRGVAKALYNEGQDVVLIDPDPAAIKEAQSIDAFVLLGDVTRREVLKEAGIRDAQIFIAATGSDERNITDYIKKINKSITVLKYDDISQLIQNCEIFIALGMSSTILEAQIFKKPVLGIRNNDMSLVPTILKNGSCQQVDIDDFPKKIKEILKNKNIQNDIIDRGTENVKNYISNLGSSSTKIQQLLASS